MVSRMTSGGSAGLRMMIALPDFAPPITSTARAVVRVNSSMLLRVPGPAEPPLVMRDTIYCSLPAGGDEAKVAQSIQDMVDEVQTYVPGYRLRGEPQFDRLEDGTGRVATFIEVEGAGDYLPPYSGNLDIMTAAATKVGDEMARELLAAETEIEDGS